MIVIQFESEPFFELQGDPVAQIPFGGPVVWIRRERAFSCGEKSLDHPWMRTIERPESNRIHLTVGDLFSLWNRLVAAPVDLGLVVLGLKRFLGADVSVVKNSPARMGRVRIASFFAALEDQKEQSLRCPDGNRRFDDSGCAAIPPRGPGLGVGVSVKVKVVEDKRFDAAIVLVTLHVSPDGRKILFMHNFVALEIKGPVSGTIEQGDRFLLAVVEAANAIVIAKVLVPLRLDDSELGFVHPQEYFPGVVLARTQGNDKLIDNREDGPNRLYKRIAEKLPIAKKGKSADSHRSPF